MDNNNYCNSDNKSEKKFKIKAINPKTISGSASIKYASAESSCCTVSRSKEALYPITKYDML